MRFIKDLSNSFFDDADLILENKDQALSILRKNGLDEQNLDYLEIKNAINIVFKNNLNYLGLMTKYRFEQEISIQEIKDLMPWLKDNGNRLSKNPLEYKEFEDLKDEIIKIDNKQRVRTVYNILPKRQKDLVNGNKDFYEKALAIHKLGFIKEFGRKLSDKKTKEEILDYMSNFIEKNSDSVTYEKTITSLRKLNSRISYEDPDNGIILARILDFETSNKIGSPDWCIVTHRSNWNDYVSGSNMQFFYWDFSLERTNSQFMVGFTTNGDGDIIYIHDKYDISLVREIPEKISEVLVKVDFSTDPFEYRKKILAGISINKLIIRIDDGSNPNLIISSVNDIWGYRSLKSKTHPILSFDNELRKYNVYMVFNFEHGLSSAAFCYVITSCVLSNENDVLLEVFDNIGGVGKIEVEENGDYIILEKDDYAGIFEDDKIADYIMRLYKKDFLKPRDRRELFEKHKKNYLDKIEPYVKGVEEISPSYQNIKSVYINTSDDPGSTGKYWLFKIESNREFEKFSTSIMYKYIRFGEDTEIQKNNYYVLIDIDEEFDSESFVKFIKINENKIEIKLNEEGEKLLTEITPDISELVKDKFIIPKTSAEYSREYLDARKNIFDEAEAEYSDEKVDLYGRALFEYLTDTDIIDKDDYMEYDDDDNEIGIPDDTYRQVLIPSGEFYDLLNFGVYTNTMITQGRGYSKSEWAIGTDEEADRAVKSYYENLIDDIGPTGFNEYFWKNHLDTEKLADYMLEGEDDYYREEITSNPQYYNLEKTMKDGVEEKIEDVNQHINELEERIKRYEERKSNVEDKFEDYKNSRPPDEKEEEEVDNYENLIEEYTDEINKMETEKSDLEDEIGYMEDENDDDFWEIDESDIDAEVESQLDNKRRDIERDPSGYCAEMGHDDKFLADFIDIEALIEDAISSDGRGTMSGYDSDERETSYDGVDYYIYRTN